MLAEVGREGRASVGRRSSYQLLITHQELSVGTRPAGHRVRKLRSQFIYLWSFLSSPCTRGSFSSPDNVNNERAVSGSGGGTAEQNKASNRRSLLQTQGQHGTMAGIRLVVSAARWPRDGQPGGKFSGRKVRLGHSHELFFFF